MFWNAGSLVYNLSFQVCFVKLHLRGLAAVFTEVSDFCGGLQSFTYVGDVRRIRLFLKGTLQWSGKNLYIVDLVPLNMNLGLKFPNSTPFQAKIELKV